MPNWLLSELALFCELVTSRLGHLESKSLDAAGYNLRIQSCFVLRPGRAFSDAAGAPLELGVIKVFSQPDEANRGLSAHSSMCGLCPASNWQGASAKAQLRT